MKAEDISKLKTEVSLLSQGLSRWKEIAKDPRYDKTGLGFDLDTRFKGSEEIRLDLTSWSGVYGSSSCSTVFSGLSNYFTSALLIWLNTHIIDVLEGTLAVMKAELAKCRDVELERARRELTEIESW